MLFFGGGGGGVFPLIHPKHTTVVMLLVTVYAVDYHYVFEQLHNHIVSVNFFGISSS